MTADSADVVEIVDSDPSWPARFAEEVVAIRRALGPEGPALQYEHIGSTAVPGLAAKPIIDVLLVPADGEWPGERIRAALTPLGYLYWDDNPNPRHLFFVKGMPPIGTRRTHHVHVRPRADAAPILTFRDRLRARPELARAYERLKRELAARHPTDREAYTRGKDAFVSAVLAGDDGPASC
jgi:GrpB-like predicted nucleotidyltransferase (UPF0157 family)